MLSVVDGCSGGGLCVCPAKMACARQAPGWPVVSSSEMWMGVTCVCVRCLGVHWLVCNGCVTY